jgi:hypothetical protein
LNINVNITNKRQDCKMGTVCGALVGGGMKEMEAREYGRWTSYTYRHRTKKPLAIALSGAARGLRGSDNGGDVMMYNVSNWNFRYESPPPRLMNIS